MDNKKSVIVGLFILVGILTYLIISTKTISTSVKQMNDAEKKLWDAEVKAIRKTLNYNAIYSKAGMGDPDFKSLDYACQNANDVLHTIITASEVNYSCNISKDGKTYTFKVIGTGKFEGTEESIVCTNNGC